MQFPYIQLSYFLLLSKGILTPFGYFCVSFFLSCAAVALSATFWHIPHDDVLFVPGRSLSEAGLVVNPNYDAGAAVSDNIGCRFLYWYEHKAGVKCTLG